MRGISKERLKELRNKPHQDKETVGTLDWLIAAHCKELQEPWMTLDEFLKSGFNGFCWIKGRNNEVLLADFMENDFYIAESSNRHDISKITHVMPIPKPESPR